MDDRLEPGFLVYWDEIENSILPLTNADEFKQLFEWAVDYRRNGVLPNISENAPHIKLIWKMIERWIQQSRASYKVTCVKSRYGNYKKQQKKLGNKQVPDFPEWWAWQDDYEDDLLSDREKNKQAKAYYDERMKGKQTLNSIPREPKGSQGSARETKGTYGNQSEPLDSKLKLNQKQKPNPNPNSTSITNSCLAKRDFDPERDIPNVFDELFDKNEN